MTKSTASLSCESGLIPSLLQFLYSGLVFPATHGHPPLLSGSKCLEVLLFEVKTGQKWKQEDLDE